MLEAFPPQDRGKAMAGVFLPVLPLLFIMKRLRHPRCGAAID